MPHFVSKNKFVLQDLPISDEYELLYELNCVGNDSLSMVPVLTRGKSKEDGLFFVKCTKRDSDFLYRIDKITRPQDLSLVKRVLLGMSTGLDVISHNLSSVNQRHVGGFKSSYLVDIQDLVGFKPNVVEVGFGSGRQIVDIARQSPDKLILGIEVHIPSITQTLNSLERLGLSNVRICKIDARMALEGIAGGCVQRILLHFPVPWNKSKGRRVFSPAFLNECLRVLRCGGRLEIRSDDYEYVRDCISDLLDLNVVRFSVSKNYDVRVRSKYEERWRSQNRDIYDVCVRKKDNFSYDSGLESDFSFPSTDEETLCRVSSKKYIRDDCFVSMGSVYRNDGLCVVPAVVGNFKAPFSTYLMLTGKRLSYLKRPLRVLSHIKSHQLLLDVIKRAVV